MSGLSYWNFFNTSPGPASPVNILPRITPALVPLRGLSGDRVSSCDTAKCFSCSAGPRLGGVCGVEISTVGRRKNDTDTIYLSAKWVIDNTVDGLKFAAAPRALGRVCLACRRPIRPAGGGKCIISPLSAVHPPQIYQPENSALSVRAVHKSDCTFSICAL